MLARKIFFAFEFRKLRLIPVISKPTFRQILVSSVVLISSFMHGCKDGYLQASMPMFMSEDSPIKVSENHSSWIASVSFSGTILAVTFRYILGDRVSRKWFLLGCTLITTASWFCILVTSSSVVIIISLFFYGAVSNAFSIIGHVYMGEVASPKNRELLGILFILLYSIGMQIETSLSIFESYRILIYFPFLVSVINVLSSVFMVESPCYLMMNGLEDEALNNLRWLNDKSTQLQSSADELVDIKNYINEHRSKKSEDFKIMCLPENLKLLTVMALIDGATYVSCDMILCAYGPLMVQAFEPVINATWFMNIRNAFMLFGSVSSYLTLRIFNRRSMLLFGFVTSAVIHAALATCYFIEERKDNQVTCLIFIIILLLFTIEGVCIPINETAICILKMEVFPYRMKELYVSFLEISGNVVCFVVVKFYISMNEQLGFCSLLLLYSAISCMAVVLVYKFVCDTKGKTLYEVRSDLTAK